ncbi:hypothetical protein EIY72_28125 [Pseudomonas vancouverensis]|uniref:Uncharacterized protein n=1 Tax=Pseudomonas vancouverensis TaxID=95300 RepID=A0A4V2X7N8_PSEVA|nr:hypothetical protein F7R09_00480 [Pseudomonas vancouverensis]TDB56665.1 hypothetical protein EIY72_28125 [Pseudomonas vancouverensis]
MDRLAAKRGMVVSQICVVPWLERTCVARELAPVGTRSGPKSFATASQPSGSKLLATQARCHEGSEQLFNQATKSPSVHRCRPAPGLRIR